LRLLILNVIVLLSILLASFSHRTAETQTPQAQNSPASTRPYCYSIFGRRPIPMVTYQLILSSKVAMPNAWTTAVSNAATEWNMVGTAFTLTGGNTIILATDDTVIRVPGGNVLIQRGNAIQATIAGTTITISVALTDEELRSTQIGASVATTSTEFNELTRAVFSREIVVNGRANWILTGAIPTNGFDLQGVVAHEFGHIAGLANVSCPGPVMQETIEPGQPRRLTDDDRQALRQIYPSK